MSITALQTYALPGRPGGPYAAPPAIIKAYTLPVARKLPWSLAASRTLVFILVAEEMAALSLEV